MKEQPIDKTDNLSRALEEAIRELVSTIGDCPAAWYEEIPPKCVDCQEEESVVIECWREEFLGRAGEKGRNG